MKAKILQLHNDHRIQWALIATIVFCLLLYVYFINVTVFNVVERQRIQKQIVESESSIGTLEAQYISIKNSITINTARTLGFRDISSFDFVSRKSLGKGLSSNNEI